MQSALNSTTQDNGLVRASDLKEMTVSKEELYTRRKEKVLDSLMSSMVHAATEAGSTSYTASLASEFDPKLLAEIVNELEKLGYKTVTKSETVQPDASKPAVSIVQLVVSWS